MIFLKRSIQRKFSSKLNHVRKFYKEVTIEPLESKPGAYRVLLDSRKLTTSDGHPYYLPSKALASLVAKEFELQQDYIKTSSMPLFGMTKAAVDVENSEKLQEVSIERLLRFLNSDSVSLREGKKDLRKIQDECFDPVIDRFYDIYGIQMKKNASIFDPTVENEENAKKIFENHLRNLDCWRLVSTELLITTLKSVCLGIMVMEDELTAEQGYRMSRIEEDYQSEINGWVEGAHDLDEAQLSLNVYSAKLMYDLT